MTTLTTHRNVLVLGKSGKALDGIVAGLQELGYGAEATNDFSDIVTRFDVSGVDLLVLGGKVPAERKAELRQEVAAINPRAEFVNGLAGIPGLIVEQVRGAFADDHETASQAASFQARERSIRVTLQEPAEVEVTIFWHTALTPPDPSSDSRVLLAQRLGAGDHLVAVPGDLPPLPAFASVRVGESVATFELGAAS